jgi:hypothetical protein
MHLAKLGSADLKERNQEPIHEETIEKEFGIHPCALSWAESHYLATFKDAQSPRDRIAAERVSRLLQPGYSLPALEGGADGVEKGGEMTGEPVQNLRFRWSFLGISGKLSRHPTCTIGISTMKG